MLRLLLTVLTAAVALSATTIDAISLSGSMSAGGSGDSFGPTKGSVPMFLSVASGGTTLLASGTFSFTNNGTQAVLGQTVDGPLSFQFSNAVITCLGAVGSFCPDLTINLFATVRLSDALLNPSGLFGLDGTANQQTFSMVGTLNNPAASVSASFLEPIGVGGTGGVRGNTTGPQLFIQTVPLTPSSFGLSGNISMHLAITQFATGTNISLPSSFFYSVAAADPGVPEPGTVLIVAGGLLGAFWFRRRLG